MLSSKLISLFLTSDDSDKLLAATHDLHQAIASDGIEVVLTKVSENLGDHQVVCICLSVVAATEESVASILRALHQDAPDIPADHTGDAEGGSF